mmetsp:Transcript_12178/g.26401  ORF Transcript_12178/g.26401 Transcript_12178/m.26401 type:complete len:264 (+) Transcript_12178:141-932(+)
MLRELNVDRLSIRSTIESAEKLRLLPLRSNLAAFTPPKAPAEPPTTPPEAKPKEEPMKAPTGMERPKVNTAGTRPIAAPTVPPTAVPEIAPVVLPIAAPTAPERTLVRSFGSSSLMSSRANRRESQMAFGCGCCSCPVTALDSSACRRSWFTFDSPRTMHKLRNAIIMENPTAISQRTDERLGSSTKYSWRAALLALLALQAAGRLCSVLETFAMLSSAPSSCCSDPSVNFFKPSRTCAVDSISRTSAFADRRASSCSTRFAS